MASVEDSKTKLPEDSGDRHVELENLIAQATARYSVKDYDAAADFYSKATELQADINGEMAAKNADLLYQYGRCLYHLAVRSSDVLGAKVAGEKQQTESSKSSIPAKSAKSKKSVTGDEDKVIKEKDSEPVIGGDTESRSNQQAGRPYFQFTGDENFDASDDEDDASQPDGEAGEEVEEEDDFANAFEVLDIARVLLSKRIEEEETKGQKNSQKATDLQETIKQLKDRLADTHDLQAEISLENERFPNAVVDLRASLGLKQDIFPKESCYVAEAHYKLSLALEFSSVTRQKTKDGEVDTAADAHVDETMLQEAAKEMEAAIASCELRISKEEENLRQGSNMDPSTDGKSLKATSKQDIEDVKEMVADMKQRLLELREPPVAIDEASQNKDLGGILGSILGESPATQQERLDEAAKSATDLSSLVKRKKPVPYTDFVAAEADNASTSSKRKAEFAKEVMDGGTGKKVRVSGDTEEEV
ncbi:MAG: hypothetical protein L6R37_003533 [Teloschistes peruensis]|nr:MAG: hypothetical protein L6R37_003533 [Teloschistes peruensis]